MNKNLALELIRVTEASALASARWMGKGNATAADTAAKEAMHHALISLQISATVVLGEGDQSYSPLLYNGQPLLTHGDTHTDPLDLAVDALECTRSVAFGRSNAMAIVAMTPQGNFMRTPAVYMNKIAVGAQGAGVIDFGATTKENLHRIAEAKGYSINDLTVVILDRERHKSLIEDVRRTGARIHLISDGDIAASIAVAIPGTGVDVVMGTGGAAAGVLAAAALRCVGGQILGRLEPQNTEERAMIARAGFTDVSTIYSAEDMVRGNDIMFAATGVTDGDLLNGVRYRRDGASTHSLVVRSQSRTRRFIVTEHYFDGNPDYS